MVPVTVASSPQPAPAGSCGALNSIVAGSSFGVKGFAISYRSNGVTYDVVVANLSGGINQQQEHVHIGYLSITGINQSNNDQVLTLEARGADLFAQNGTRQFIIQVELPSLQYAMNSALSKQLKIPITEIQITGLSLYLILNCQSNTYQTAASGMVSIAEILKHVQTPAF